MQYDISFRAVIVSLLVGFVGCASRGGGVESLSTSLYSRSDTNATTVWSPRLRAAAKLNESIGVESTYAIDSWTGASVDITTAATSAVHEVRQEVTAGGYYELDNVTLGGGYRYSTENDYWSNGGVANLTFDMAENNTTLAIAGFGSKDTVGKHGDSGFRKPQSSGGGRISLTQVVDTKTVIAASWETTRITGYQASPYRYVAIGGTDLGLCAGSAPLCVPEVVPGERIRNAAVLRGRRALGEKVSMGFEYRFYFDDWGVQSHTLNPTFAFLIGEHGTLDLTYRYYTQGDARFYKPRYSAAFDDVRYVTRDRELSTMYANRVGAGYSHDFELDETGNKVLTLAARTAVTRFRYLAFIGLTQVDALEATGLLSLGFR